MGDLKDICYSNPIDMYGVIWYISAGSQVDEDDGEEYFDVNLHAEHAFEKQ